MYGVIASSNRKHKPKFRVLNPYGASKPFILKGQMHCHSDNSPDAIYDPITVCQSYESRGFDFMTLTDHNYISENPGGHNMIWLANSYENATSGADVSTHQHVVIYDTSSVFYKGTLAWNAANVTVEEVLVGHANELKSLAHPNYANAYYPDTSLEAIPEGFQFVEVWNSHVQKDIATGGRAWDILLSRGFKVFGLATDDFHNTATPLANGWVEVFSDSQDSVGILTSLVEGNFIASNGVNSVNSIVINSISLSGKMITIELGTVATVRFIGKNGSILKEVEGVVSANYSITGKELYVRAEVINGNEVKWLQPFFIED